MEEKFLYYFGAGASANALPTVKQVKDSRGTVLNNGMILSMREVEATLRNMMFYSSEQQTFLIEIADNLLKYANACADFSTIDTYAKYLSLTDRKELEKLTLTLSVFFFILQVWEERVDKRYLSWITSILSDKIFPSNIKIVSWNYDFQIQLAAERFQDKLESIQRFPGVIKRTPSFIDYWPGVGWNGSPGAHFGNKTCSLIHLNGLAGTFYNNEIELYDNAFLRRAEMGKNSTMHYFREYGNSHFFTFAWNKEQLNYQNYSISLAQEMIEDTTIVVVIGYSFPFFNRDVDKRIFEKLKESGKLKKIYFQDPYLDGSFLKAQFNLDDSIEIIHRKEVDSFYIPFEL